MGELTRIMVDRLAEKSLNGHVWIDRDIGGQTCGACVRCLVIRRHDGTNKACPGWVGISLRADEGESDAPS